ncbi:hypothetical protein OA175_01130 [Gammaproteobacteria bacterium]|nr:hypothetical protein [Gammaproteobacteria bacterium]
MYIKILIAIIFALPLLIHSNEERVYKQLNKIHANPFDDSYIFVFDGSPESFSIDKISIDRPKERSLKKIKFLSDEDAYAIKVYGKNGKFIYTLGIGNPFYANYQHIGYEDREYMGGPVRSAKIELAIPLHIEPTSFIISKRDVNGKLKDIQEISIQ